MSSEGAPPVLARPAPPSGAWARLTSPKTLITLLITTILVLGEWRFSILGSYDRLWISLGTCMLVESLLSLWTAGRLRSVQSAYISGISLTLLTRPLAGNLWPFVLGGALAICSKYALTWRGRHLWNPTNFAISALLLLAPGTVTILSHEFGNDLRVNAVIWSLGLLIVWRARLLHVTGTYALAFCAFAALRSAVTGVPLLVELAPITGPMYQLFVFFMITDPPTTVSTRRGRVLTALTIALVETLLRLGNDYGLALAAPFAPAPAIFALALVGPLAKGLDLERRARAA